MTLCSAALLAVLLAPVAASAADAGVTRWRQAHEAAITGQLASMVQIESVAANPAGLAQQADSLVAALAARGFAARLLPVAGGPPLVFGALDTPGARRTIVFYAHYDGQPVKPADWATPPFTPVLRAGTLDKPIVAAPASGRLDPEIRLFGRAASDDKASIIAFLAAFDALKATGRKPAINIRIAWEGEEEVGSPHLEAAVTAYRDLLKSDLWLIGDGPVHQSRRPTISFGARGVMGLDMTVYGPVRALHDGHYGNWVPNPAAMAANLVAAMRDDDGNILIPGFADDVRALTPAESAAIAALPPVDAALMAEFGIARHEGADGLTLATMRPALNVRGLRAGGTGSTAANAIPTEAEVSIDFRLVPGQTPERVRAKVEAFLAARGWTLVSAAPDMATRLASPRLVRLAWQGGYPGLRSDMSDAAGRAVIAAASAAAGAQVLTVPMEGGSVPIYIFDRLFGVPIISLPIANHDNSQHAANENLRLQNLWDGIDAYAAMLTRLDW
ncbi:MAG: M20/M25/M40 family metallo-hydrolase [Sandarakinorhabdus sp.]|nr:M20/M25/M40 family metallo-hydrolase [Sandarakinorhabdus sp.]